MKNRIRLAGSIEDCRSIQSVMYFPTDKHLRESWCAKELAKGCLAAMDNVDTITMDKEHLDRLIDAPSFEELKCERVMATKKGIAAGSVLAGVYLMDRFKMPEPSLKKALHLAQHFAARIPYSDSTPTFKSRRLIRKAFNDYKSVAHLWAALRLSVEYGYADDGELFFEKLPSFLELCAGLLEFGTTFIPYRAKLRVPILPPDGMWELPAGTAARHLSIDAFPSSMRDLLDAYDAYDANDANDANEY